MLRDPRERADCVAREQAREQARAQVQRQVDGAASSFDAPPSFDAPATARGASSDDRNRTAAWQAAVDEASGVDAGAILEPRPIAALAGLAWFLLVVRVRRRRRRGVSAS